MSREPGPNHPIGERSKDEAEKEKIRKLLIQ